MSQPSVLSSFFLTVCDLGKSFALTYVLISRLLDGKPTIFQVVPEIAYLYCDRGVFSFDPQHGKIMQPLQDLGLTLNRQCGPLLLVDTNMHLTLPPPFSLCGQHFFVVQACSLAQGDWIKQIGAIRHCMKPWTLMEILTG